MRWIHRLAWPLGLALGVLLALGMAGCVTGPETEREFSDGVTEITVAVSQVEPQVEEYREMEACAGLTGNPYAVRWYRLAGPIVFSDGQTWYGAYNTERRAVYFYDRASLRHEILHDLVFTNLRDYGHPSPPFGVCVPYVVEAR